MCAVTAAIVLAAGASTRLGEPKQLVKVGGERLLDRAVRIARSAGCVPVIVVLGSAAAEILTACSLHEAQVIVNADWEEGMSASIACGVAALRSEVEGVVILACDQPAVTAEHLQALMASGEMTASAYAGRHGIPAYFPAAAFDDLLELRGDVGAREMLRDAQSLELAGGEFDVDQAEDLVRAQNAFL